MTASEEATDKSAEEVPIPGGSFLLFVQKLGYQALIGMGVIENPLTRTKDANLEQAKIVIDDLMMIRDKTAGNLDSDEEAHLTQIIGNLQQHFVSLSNAPDSPAS